MLKEAILQKDLYKDLEQFLMSSGFLDEDNEYTDELRIAGYGEVEITESANTLLKTLKSFFKQRKIPVSVVVSSIDPSDVMINDEAGKSQNNQNPNNYLIAAEAGLNNRGKMQLILHTALALDDFDTSLMDKEKIIHSICTAIRHEFVHDRQYTALSKKLKITRPQAKQKYEDWGNIPPEGAPREQYLGSHIEIDAFGHEFAEMLANKFGVDKAMELVSTSDSSQLQAVAKEIEFGDNLREYYIDHPQDKFTGKLQKKIRKYLLAFKQEAIYENYLYSKWKKIILVG
jgi:hypothetical protein